MKKRLGETAGNDGGFGICLSPFFILMEALHPNLYIIRYFKEGVAFFLELRFSGV
ncbi:MAG: hypothetical protein SPJ62_14880 [Inconstantimicrobium porci]|uniref:hypothetical protein n=1 Tax=Inconstantimicrobium porci TaxID=2652291 RepID=UPI0012B394E2|nr:hypothetical protein [Inconstantimicrobium porci]MDD6771934.1 hypothetical protein [Inconstantimicrobium porci]MDY5913254.1 hypothetical protein [Inconstantimicrobium porci]